MPNWSRIAAVGIEKVPRGEGALGGFLCRKTAGDAQIKVLCGLAICSARTGQIEKAKKLYAELVEKDPKHR